MCPCLSKEQPWSLAKRWCQAAKHQIDLSTKERKTRKPGWLRSYPAMVSLCCREIDIGRNSCLDWCETSLTDDYPISCRDACFFYLHWRFLPSQSFDILDKFGQPHSRWLRNYPFFSLYQPTVVGQAQLVDVFQIGERDSALAASLIYACLFKLRVQLVSRQKQLSGTSSRKTAISGLNDHFAFRQYRQCKCWCCVTVVAADVEKVGVGIKITTGQHEPPQCSEQVQ